ncbi:MAG TPA: hypothetical protein VII06_28845 [Chloroflexota bacterium]|jgi:hypothetical protein
MASRIESVDIADPNALVRAAEDVERTRQPRIVTRGDQEIAVLSPIRPTRRSPGRRLTMNDSLFSVIGKAHVDNPDAVVDNVDEYLAQAYSAEFDTPTEK